MTGDELQALITRRFGTGHGVRARAARGLGLSPAYLYMMVSGKRPIPEKLADRFSAPSVSPEVQTLVDNHIDAIASEAEVLGFPLHTVRLAVRDSVASRLHEDS